MPECLQGHTVEARVKVGSCDTDEEDLFPEWQKLTHTYSFIHYTNGSQTVVRGPLRVRKGYGGGPRERSTNFH